MWKEMGDKVGQGLKVLQLIWEEMGDKVGRGTKNAQFVYSLACEQWFATSTEEG